MTTRSSRAFIITTLLPFVIAPLLLIGAVPARAAATIYVSSPHTVKVGDTVTVSVRTSTGSTRDNSIEANLAYTDGVLQGVRGTYSGSVITIPISQPDPSSGAASIAGGNPGGWVGDVLIATIIFTAQSAGTANFGLSGCSEIVGDGSGTSDNPSCSGSSTTVEPASTPPPAATAAPSTPPPAAAPVATPKPKSNPTPTPTPHSSQTPKPAETPAPSVVTPVPTSPPVIALPKTTPTPVPTAQTTSTTATPAPADQKRSVAAAFRDLFASIKDFQLRSKDAAGLIALILSIIPILIVTLAIVYFIYRLYIMERKRRHTLDRLFEMELSELAALEGKLDVLSQKGSKGREEYRAEFQKSKENILRQLRPDYGKPIVDSPKV